MNESITVIEIDHSSALPQTGTFFSPNQPELTYDEAFSVFRDRYAGKALNTKMVYHTQSDNRYWFLINRK